MQGSANRELTAAAFLFVVATTCAAAAAEMKCNQLATAEQRLARQSRAAARTAEFIATLTVRDFVGAADFFRYPADRSAAELEGLMGAVIEALELIAGDLGVPEVSDDPEASPRSGSYGRFRFWSVDIAPREEHWPFSRAVQEICVPTVELLAFENVQPGLVSLVLDDDPAGGAMEVIAAQFGLHPSVPGGKERLERLDAKIARLFAWRAPLAAEGLDRQAGGSGG